MRVAVLGGGLQGACVALELSARGVAVDLFEAQERCLTRASAQNEGKIHLGYVYANDASLSTARTMVRGGLSFASLLRRWLGDAIDSVPVSRPFNYVVHRSSLLEPDRVEAHLLACRELALEAAGGRAIDYFGADPLAAPVQMGGREARSLYTENVSAVFRTSEVGIDPEALATLVRARLDADRSIRCRTGTRVRQVERAGAGLDVEFQNGAGPARERYDQV
ncbi:MAG: FAD-dependent oxidoreductase, partial [Ilumatobacteraceae bacterium]